MPTITTRPTPAALGTVSLTDQQSNLRAALHYLVTIANNRAAVAAVRADAMARYLGVTPRSALRYLAYFRRHGYATLTDRGYVVHGPWDEWNGTGRPPAPASLVCSSAGH